MMLKRDRIRSQNVLWLRVCHGKFMAFGLGAEFLTSG